MLSDSSQVSRCCRLHLPAVSQTSVEFKFLTRVLKEHFLELLVKQYSETSKSEYEKIFVNIIKKKFPLIDFITPRCWAVCGYNVVNDDLYEPIRILCF